MAETRCPYDEQVALERLWQKMWDNSRPLDPDLAEILDRKFWDLFEKQEKEKKSDAK